MQVFQEPWRSEMCRVCPLFWRASPWLKAGWLEHSDTLGLGMEQLCSCGKSSNGETHSPAVQEPGLLCRALADSSPREQLHVFVTKHLGLRMETLASQFQTTHFSHGSVLGLHKDECQLEVFSHFVLKLSWCPGLGAALIP